LRRGRFEQAAACLAAETSRRASGPGTAAARLLAEARLGLGLKHVHADDHAAARAEFERALRFDPWCWLAGRQLARVLVRSGEPRAALAWLDRAAWKTPETMDTALLRAVCLAALGQLDAARRALDAALSTALASPLARRPAPPVTPIAAGGRGRAEPSGGDRWFHADHRHRLGVRLFDPRPEEAALHLEAAVALNPRYLRARLALGLVRLAQRRGRDAVEQLEAARELEPAYPDVRSWLGLARLAVGNPRGAVEALESAIALRREFARAHRHLALAHHALGRTAEALRAARRAALRDGEGLLPPNRLGLPGLEAEGAGEDDLERALAIRPASPDLLLALGRRRRELGDPGEARRAFRAAVALDPGFATAVLELAQAELALTRPREAEALLGDLTARRPGWVDAQALLGRTRLVLGNARGAVLPLRAALRQRPDFEPARMDLAWALLGAGGGRLPADEGAPRAA
jgi:tetratricopeptide (TPR) repeat protein